MQPNGSQIQLPAIIIGWDDNAKQIAGIKFNPDVFKNLGFVEAVLRMALENVEAQRKMQLAVEMQQAQQQAAHDQEIKRRLSLGG